MKNILWICTAFLTCIMPAGCSEDETPSFGGIYGIVSDVKTGEPLRAAEIILSPGNLSTITGQSGHFEFNDLEAGQYKMQVSADGYLTNTRQITVVPGQNASGDISLTEESLSAKIRLSTSSLNFGSEHSSLNFSIHNIGNAGIVNWHITDIEPWLTVSPIRGETDMGKSSVVVVTIDRSLIESEKTSTIVVVAEGESFPVVITARPGSDYSFSVTPDQLAFATDETIKKLTLRNDNYNGTLDWNISGDYPDWLASVYPSGGALRQGESATVTVTVDRNLIASKVSATLCINAGEKVIPVIVSCDYSQSPSTPYTEISPDASIDFGKTKTTATVTMKAYYAAVEYTADFEGYAPYMSLNKTKGTLSDYQLTQRAETLTLTADRSKMYSDTEDCTLVITAGNDTYRLRITVSKESSSGGGGGGGGGGGSVDEDYSSATITQCDSRIKAQIVSCKRSGSSVVFTYTLTNNGLGTVNDFRIYPPSSLSVIQGGTRSMITDNLGNEYPYPTMTFRTGSTTGVNILNASFPDGMACNGTVTLKDVPVSASKITALIGVYAYPGSTYNLANTGIRFKNVPIY